MRHKLHIRDSKIEACFFSNSMIGKVHGRHNIHWLASHVSQDQREHSTTTTPFPPPLKKCYGFLKLCQSCTSRLSEDYENTVLNLCIELLCQFDLSLCPDKVIQSNHPSKNLYNIYPHIVFVFYCIFSKVVLRIPF